MGILDTLTAGQVISIVTIFAGLLGSIAYLKTNIESWLKKALADDFDDIKTEIKGVNDRLDIVDLEGCKNYLVMVLAKVEQGGKLDEVEKERFYEQYEHYKKLGGNTYIQQKVEKFQRDYKL